MTPAHQASWARSIVNPTCALTIDLPQELALAVIRVALDRHRAVGGVRVFRLEPEGPDRSVIARVGNAALAWMTPFQGFWPYGARGRLVFQAGSAAEDTVVRCTYTDPMDAGRRGVPRALAEVVRHLVESGATVDVGPWGEA